MIRILCYGDSNTWGYISGSDHLRYDETKRWTKLLQKKLGKHYEVIEEGLSSRTLFSHDNDPEHFGRVGFDYLKPCLETHDKLDVVILMLGTNELKAQFNNSPQDIFNMFKKFVLLINDFKSKVDGGKVKLVVSGLPPVDEQNFSDEEKDKFKNAQEKCRQTNLLYKNYCYENNILFVDNSGLTVGVDGVHLTQQSHNILSDKLFKIIKENI